MRALTVKSRSLKSKIFCSLKLHENENIKKLNLGIIFWNPFNSQAAWVTIFFSYLDCS